MVPEEKGNCKQVRITVVVQELDVRAEDVRGIKLAKEVSGTWQDIEAFFHDASEATKVVFGEGHSTIFQQQMEQQTESLKLRLELAEIRLKTARLEIEHARHRDLAALVAARVDAVPFMVPGPECHPTQVDDMEHFKKMMGLK